MIQFENIRKEFGPTVALDDVTVDFRRGQLTAILGENGSGKSTLIKMISGVVEPTSGSLTIDDQLVKRFEPANLRKHGVAVCHQELLVAPNRSVTDNVHLGRDTPFRRVLTPRQKEASAQQMMTTLGAGGVDYNAAVSELPIVIQQIVVIARALVTDSPVVVLDEPTAALGQSERAALFEELDRRRTKGDTIILVSHRMDEVLAHCDRVVVLANGELVGAVERDAFDEKQLLQMMVPA